MIVMPEDAISSSTCTKILKEALKRNTPNSFSNCQQYPGWKIFELQQEK